MTELPKPKWQLIVIYSVGNGGQFQIPTNEDEKYWRPIIEESTGWVDVVDFLGNSLRFNFHEAHPIQWMVVSTDLVEKMRHEQEEAKRRAYLMQKMATGGVIVNPDRLIQ